MRRLNAPYLLMTLAMLFWAVNWLLGRALRADVTPIGLNFWRWSIALLLLTPFAAPRLRRNWPLVRRHWLLLLALGFIGVTLFHQFVYLALQYTTAVNAALFNSTSPIFIVCISWLLFRDTISWRQALGIALSLGGVLAIVTRGELGVLLQLHFNPGDLWALLSVPIWGLYTVLLKRRPAELDALVFLAAISVVGVVLMLPLYGWDVARGGHMRFTPATVGAVVYMAVFASLLAYVFWNSAVPRVGANKAGLFLHLHPVFTTLLAIAFLGERLHRYHGAAIALIVGGIYLTTAAPDPALARAHPASAPPAPPP